MSVAIEANKLEIAEHGAPARLKSRTEDAFVEGEREGLMLAAKVRIIAIGVIFLWQFVDNQGLDLSFFVGLAEISSFAVLGFLQYICAKQRFHMHVLKYVFVLVDCVLLAFVFSAEYSFQEYVLPPALQMEGSRFGYFFIFLMQAAFSLRPRLVLWCGLCIVVARTGMLLWFASRPGVSTQIDLPEQTIEAFLKAYTDSNFIFLGFGQRRSW